MEIIEDPGEKLSISLVSNARLYIQGKRINAHIQINKSVYTRIEKAGLKLRFFIIEHYLKMLKLGKKT